MEASSTLSLCLREQQTAQRHSLTHLLCFCTSREKEWRKTMLLKCARVPRLMWNDACILKKWKANWEWHWFSAACFYLLTVLSSLLWVFRYVCKHSLIYCCSRITHSVGKDAHFTIKTSDKYKLWGLTQLTNICSKNILLMLFLNVFFFLNPLGLFDQKWPKTFTFWIFFWDETWWLLSH